MSLINKSDDQIRLITSNALGIQANPDMRKNPAAAKPLTDKGSDFFENSNMRKVDLPDGAPTWGGRAYVDGDNLYACSNGMFHEDMMCFSIPAPIMQLE